LGQTLGLKWSTMKSFYSNDGQYCQPFLNAIWGFLSFNIYVSNWSFKKPIYNNTYILVTPVNHIFTTSINNIDDVKEWELILNTTRRSRQEKIPMIITIFVMSKKNWLRVGETKIFLNRKNVLPKLRSMKDRWISR
jgi:hypothetical protein